MFKKFLEMNQSKFIKEDQNEQILKQLIWS